MIKRHPTLGFLALCFAISWFVVAFAAGTMVAERGQQVGILALIFIGQFGPTLAALIVFRKLYGKGAIRRTLKAAVAVRQPVALWLFALLFYPLMYSVALAIALYRGAPAPAFGPELYATMALTFVGTLLIGLIFGGLSEEVGWRAFLLPRLQDRVGFIGAGLIISALWSVWHLDPEYLARGWNEGWGTFWSLESKGLLAYLKETIPVTFVMAWLYNRSRGSLFLVILIHATSNAGVNVLGTMWPERPEIWSQTIFWVQWALGLVFVLWGLRQPMETQDHLQKTSEAAGA